jgi:GNAT superfamily N-acetyltransferase
MTGTIPQSAGRTMPSPKAKTMAPADEAAAVDTIVLAFATDPMARWSWPDAHQYLVSMPRLVRAFGGGAFQHESAYCTDHYIGTALWLPPGVHPDEQVMTELTEHTVADAIREDLFGVFEQMAKYHPTEPHWYLPLIGVDPAHQNQGHGNVLMAYALTKCDRDHLPAYLESSNPRNMPLYQRHGFEPLGTIQVGTSPPMVPMLRRAR